MNVDDVCILVRKFEGCRVMVLGDLMLDEYLWGHIQRISPEVPVPIMKLTGQEYTLGGAGNVVKNLRSLGAKVVTLGVVGIDSTGGNILKELDKLDVDYAIIKQNERESTQKTRLTCMEHERQVFRFDQESCHFLTSNTEDTLLSLVGREMQDVQAVLCSDYSKGVLSPKLLQTTIAFARQCGLPVVITPKGSDASK